MVLLDHTHLSGFFLSTQCISRPVGGGLLAAGGGGGQVEAAS